MKNENAEAGTMISGGSDTAVRRGASRVAKVLSAHGVTAACIVIIASGILFAIAYGRSAQRRNPEALFVSDGFGYYIYLPSLVIDRDLDLSNQLAVQEGQAAQQWYQVSTHTGRPGNCFQVGCAVLWAPFFLIAHAVVLSANGLGASIPATGFGLAYEAPVYYGSFLYGVAGIGFMRRLVRQTLGAAVAATSVFYTAAATALAAYLWFEPDMSHVISASLIAAYFVYVRQSHASERLAWRDWAKIGLLLGVIASVRVPDALVVLAALVVAAELCMRLRPPFALILKSAVACLVGALVGFLPQMAAWTVLYGGPLTRPPGIYENLHWLAPDLASYLFSTKRGVFIWTPSVVVSAFGAAWGLCRGSMFLRTAFAVLVAAVYFNSVIPNWWVGASFSERRLVDYSALLALGFGVILGAPSVARHKLLTHAVGISLVAFNWILMLRYFSHDLPEYGDVPAWELFGGTVTFIVKLAERAIGA